jgi:uroporphyrinogen decarboxylase
MKKYTGRERVKKVLNKEIPDRPPCFHRGYAPNSDLVKDKLSVNSIGDFVDVGGYISFSAPDGWTIPERDGVYFDELGVGRSPKGLYWNVVHRPLADVSDPKALDDYPFPDPTDKSRVRHVKESVEKVIDSGKAVALMGSFGGSTGIFEQAWYMTGMEKFLTDLYINLPFAEALLDKQLEIHKNLWQNLLEEVGDEVDLACTGDDLGTQDRLLLSPQIYRDIIKPRQKELIDHIKRYTSSKIYYHTCGNVMDILDDLIEIGVDVLDPVQPKAMDTKMLSERYGDRLVFFGGIDEQEILPFGTTDDVRREVFIRFETLGKNGGWIAGPAHWIQVDTPEENIIAMYEAIHECQY